jgi:hypothetical protein
VTKSDLIPILVLIPFCLAVILGCAIVMLVLRFRHKHSFFQNRARVHSLDLSGLIASPALFPNRPNIWVAIRSRDLLSVQSALGLSNPRPCSITQGLASEQKLFIAPPVHGWILVTGSGLPDPSDDVDACFRFQLTLSRKLGTVQFFCSNSVLGHHAWICMEGGRVVRAYAWAGKTLWNQGVRTRAELELGLKSFQYFESPDETISRDSDWISINTEKVPLLAARWSLDPATIDQYTLEHAFGVAGEPSRLY